MMIFKREIWCRRDENGNYADLPDNPHSILEIATDYYLNMDELGKAVDETVKHAAALSMYLANVSGSKPENLLSNAEYGFEIAGLSTVDGLSATAEMLEKIGEKSRAQDILCVIEGQADELAKDAFLGWDLSALADATGTYLRDNVEMKSVPASEWEQAWKNHIEA